MHLYMSKDCLQNLVSKGLEVASYPAFPRLSFNRLSIFYTVSNKNLRRGKAGYEARLEVENNGRPMAPSL